MDEDINKQLDKALSSIKVKNALRELGFSPDLPYVVKSIDDVEAYTPRQVAELLNFSRQHICRLCNQGIIASVQITPRGKHCIYGETIKRFVLDKLTYPSFIKKIYN